MTVSDSPSPEFLRAEEAARWCVRLCEGEMTTAARGEFTRWLTSDPAHRAAFDQAVAAWEDIAAAEASPEVLALRVEALESLQRAQRARAGGRLPALRTRWMVAASLVIALLFLGILAWRELSPQQFASGIGQRRNVLLGDGSSVSLDASSEVLVRYSARQRTLHLLRGRAKFQVAKDPTRPFLVYAADREIVATGTTFSVEIVQKEVQVVLYEGHVSVLGPDHVRTPLLAGEELLAPISLAQVHVASVDAGHSLSWESNQLEFVNEPLASAVERVNRYARTPVAIGDAAAASERISGVFAAGDTRAFVEGVTAVSTLRAEERNGREVLWGSGRTKR
jgi:transmembrane sensor